MLDLAKNPGPSLRGAANHQAVGAGERKNFAGTLWRLDVAVRDNRNSDCVLDGADRLVLDGADECACACAAVYRNRGDASAFRHARNRHCIARIGAWPCPNLERDRHVDGGNDRRYD